MFDSRQIMSPHDSIFFAIKSEKNNGHQYISELYEKGIRHFIIEENVAENKYPLATFFKVENTIQSLQGIAGKHRQNFSYPIIGITGSNGKTIVKEWLYQLLKDDFKIVRSPQSYNSQIGVPISVWQMNENHNLGIFEAGVSRRGEMKKIAPIIACDFGIFTSLGTAHDAGFSDLEEKAKEKSGLFYQAKKIIYRKDIKEVDECVSNLNARAITWSFSLDSNLSIKKIQERKDGKYGANIQASYQSQLQSGSDLKSDPDLAKTIEINIPFSDEVSCYNAIICWLALLEMNIPNEEINKRMQGLEIVAMRLELKKGINQTTLINDTYNLDLTSLQSSLRFMESQAGNKNKTLIISDILQHDLNNESTYQTIADWVNNDFNINRIIGVGKEIVSLDYLLHKNVKRYFYKTTDSFLEDLQNLTFKDEIILVKGARDFRFERVVSRLEQQAHRTVLEVNFNALKNNLNTYKDALKPETKIMVMVKASAYGTGAAKVAKLLETEGVDYMTVAYIDEGVELREAGVNTPILVLNPEPSGFEAMLRNNLEPEIYSLQQLKQFYDFIENHNIGKKQEIPIHLKLDTGMRRLGFEEKDLMALILFLQNKKAILIKSIFSHLAGSDAAEHDDFTKQQILRFERMHKRISEALRIKPIRHILNSAGISRFPDYQFDMVRLGIGLYGIETSENMQGKLNVISTLKASISQIKTLNAGESVGYNRGGKVFKPTKIATVSIGYADGLSRAAGYGKYSLLVRGQKAKTIGVICMDMCMIDISNIPTARVGDEVIVYGENPRIEELATCMNTIPYEVLTSISDRVKRVYVLD